MIAEQSVDLDRNSIAGDPFVGLVIVNDNAIAVKKIHDVLEGGVLGLTPLEPQRRDGLRQPVGEELVGTKRWVLGD